MKLSHPIAHVFMLMVALIYGSNYAIAKIVLDPGHIHPAAFILMRVSFAAIVFLVIEQISRPVRIHKSDIGRLFLCGLFGATANQLLFFYGLKNTTPINAAMIMTTTPIVVLTFAVLAGKEKVTMMKLAGILLGMTGAGILIMSGGGLSFSSDNLNGDLMVLLNAMSYAIYLIIVKDLLTKYPPLTVIKWVFVFGLIGVIPFGIGPIQDIHWGDFTMTIWLAIGFVLVFTTVLAYLLNINALQVVNSSTVSIYIYLQPVFATIVSGILGKGSLQIADLPVFLMIFAGVFLVSMPKPRKS